MTVPEGYIEWMQQRVQPDVVERFVAALQEPSPTSIRINPTRLSSENLPEGFSGRVPWCNEGYYLDERPTFTADPLLHAGAYYVQEASSMYLAHALKMVTGDRFIGNCLDLCAAPGGKSTLLRSVLPSDSLLVANEALPKRAAVLAENIAKWGGSNTIVTNAYPKEFAAISYSFSLIVANVPCSGEGMFRKEPDAVSGWSIAAVEHIAALQRSIIYDIWPALQYGGTLIYSTCTVNPLEDEDNVDWIARELGADIIPIEVPSDWHILGDLRSSGTLESHLLLYSHLLPGFVQGEGFFLAALRKHGEPIVPSRRKKDSDLPSMLQKKLKVLPTDQLGNPKECLPVVSVSLSDAIRYLRRETITLPSDTPRGIIQIAYQGQRLGLAKNLGTRANNLYPKEWRILSQHLTPHSLF